MESNAKTITIGLSRIVEPPVVQKVMWRLWQQDDRESNVICPRLGSDGNGVVWQMIG
jgi:hypothetical protein